MHTWSYHEYASAIDSPNVHSSLVSTENFEVTSPWNVVGIVGQDTILPCHVSSTKPLDDIEVRWKKITDGHIEDIHIYRQSGGKPAQKYLGRTSLLTDGFATGNVSLTLKNVQPADEGTYSCFVKSRDWSADTTTVLSIAGVEKNTQDADRGDLKIRCGKRPFTVENGKGVGIVENRQTCTALGKAEVQAVCVLMLCTDQRARTVKHKPSTQTPIIERQLPIVVGREGFASGHHYWEVQVWNGLDWELGVLTETVRGRLKERSWEELPEDGVWSLRRVNGEYWPEEVNTVMQSQTVQLPVVGLDLDLEQSTLSFYNTGASDRILENSIKASTKLYPFLRPGLGEAGEMGKPLTINHNADWDFPQTVLP
ncbi:PREDICTED: butyrophilin subfamily 2 member A2-like [Nipponia nippon]|uniref:butyrophilin subfamily 2 member A2-like n=1 Tax=Nipponia nippon TaxID=128390 RepID=UPI0005109325|nr:PREDICTED: butyrophilin subfamily 2 member A2-like [Nipponia nippon]